MEAWLATAVFGLLLLIWVVLPGRLVRRERDWGRRPEETRPTVKRAQASSLTTASALPRQPHPHGKGRPTTLPAARLVRNQAFDGHRRDGSPRYFLVTDLHGLDGYREVRIPIFWEPAAGSDILRKETYRADVAGIRVEAGNLPALQAMIADALREIGRSRRLPPFWFHLPHGGTVPVYRRDRGYEARVPEGPRVVGDTLAEVRERVHRYYLTFGKIPADEEVRFLALGPDLRPNPPIAELVGPDLWLPVFRMDGRLQPEGVVGLDPQAFRTPGDLLRLREYIATEHTSQNGDRGGQICLTGLSTQTWMELTQVLAPTERRLSYRPHGNGTEAVSLPIFRSNGTVLCARGTESYSMYFGQHDWELAEQLGDDLVREGVILHRDDVRINRGSLGR